MWRWPTSSLRGRGRAPATCLRGRAQPTRGSAGYGVFRCADGGWITLAVISEDHFWKAVCEALELAAPLHDARSPRTARPLRRMSGRDRRGVRDAARAPTRSIGSPRAGAPVAPVLDPAEMTENEQFRAREVVFDAGDGTARLGFPARLDAHPPRPPGPIPDVDADPAAGRDLVIGNVTPVALRQDD